MAPHRSYIDAVGPALDAELVQGMAHITGGGVVDNLPRMLPEGLAAELDPETWPRPPIFDHLVTRGNVPAREQYQVFNMGLGFVAAVRSDDTERALALMPEGRVVGRVIAGDGERVRGLR
jgi:phosphoribosylformylglycinamidine cyclo-ligase